MEIGYVREVIQYGELTQVPPAPPPSSGASSTSGGRWCPCWIFPSASAGGATEIALRSCVIILEIPCGEGAVTVGVIVDNVSEVLELGASEIEPPPSFGKDPRAEFLSGVGKVGEQFVILLDVKHVLSMDELSSLSGGAVEEEAIS